MGKGQIKLKSPEEFKELKRQVERMHWLQLDNSLLQLMSKIK